MLNKEDEEV